MGIVKATISSFKKSIKNNIFAIVFILMISIAVSYPLLRPGLHSIHDDQQVARLYLYDRAIKDRQIPPRIVEELGFGFGYPLFVFYPPFVYMLGEVVHLLGFGFVSSVKLVFFLSILLSGYSMFYFSRKYVGNLAGTFSSICYLLLPYRAVDIYVRGALSEAFSFVWIPPLVFSFYALSREKSKKYLILSAIFTALLLITHNLIFISLLALLPAFIILLIGENNKRYLLLLLFIVMLLAAGLSAFFWLPSMVEKNKTLVDQILLTELASYKIHFVYPNQLWNSIWGYGGSTDGTLDGISFKVGKLHLILSFATVFLSLTLKFSSKKIKWYTFEQKKLVILMMALLLFSMLMTTWYSKLIWDYFQPLAYLQFPWRFLVLIGFSASVLAGIFIYLLKLPVLKISAFIFLTSLLVYTNLKLFKPQTYRPYFDDSYATSPEIINWDVSKSSFEYLPGSIALKKSIINTTVIDINKSEIPQNAASVISGDADISYISETSKVVSFNIKSSKGATIRLNKANFPGWVVKIDEKMVHYNDNNKFKLVEFEVESGQHKVIAEFKNTPPRTVGNLVSLASLISLVFIIKWKKEH